MNVARTVAIGLLFACSSAARPPQLEGGGSGAGTGGGTAGDAGLRPLPDGGDTACVVTGFTAGFVPKRNVYLSPAGADANDGLSPEKAWRSLKNAVRLEAGDLVNVADGAYSCDVEITAIASATAPIVIRGASLKAVFDCGSETVAFSLNGAAYVALDTLTLRGATGDLVRVGATAGKPAPDHIALLNSRLENNAGVGLRVTNATQIDVLGNDFSRQLNSPFLVEAGAVDILGTNGVRIVKNQIHDYPSNVGVQVRAGSQTILADGNRFVAVQEALRLGGASRPQDFTSRTTAFEAKGASAVNNVIQGNVGVPFEAYGCDTCLLANNTVYITGAQAAVRAATGGAGADVAGGSPTTALRVLQNIFMFTQSAPQKALDMGAEQLSAFEQARNVWFYSGGSILSVPSSPPPEGEGTVTDQDPRFANAALNLFTLLPGSPAAERGRALPQVIRDATGTCRTLLNLGAY